MQRTLFNLGAHLAGAETVGVTDNDVAKLEAAIDQWTAMSPPISTFILPGGTPAAAELHRSRTIARRAERRVLALQSATAAPFKVYLNRLSDALFAAARVANAAKGISETPWKNKS